MSYGYMHNFGYGFISSGYNPLINYKWSTTLSSGYVTDGVELVTNGDFSDADISMFVPDSGVTVERGTFHGRSNVLKVTISTSERVRFDVPVELGQVKIFGDIYVESGSTRIDASDSIILGDFIEYYADNQWTQTEFIGDVLQSTIMQTWLRANNGGVYYIDTFSVQKVIQEPNKRYFTDSGVSPKYPALMASGSGVKFNGVDQSVELAEALTETSTSFSISLQLHGIIGDNNYILRMSTTTRNIVWVSGNALKFYDIDGVNYTIDNIAREGMYTLVFNNGTIDTYFNSENVSTVTTATTTISYFKSISDVDSVYAGTISNIQLHNQALTPTQIAYQYNNPEKFLYREDNILKSQTLSQAEIDNVVAFLPMNETDGYVRDLANYSEGVEELDSASWYIGTDDDGTNTITLIEGGFELECLGDGTKTDRPMVKLDGYVSGNLPANATCILTYDIELLSGVENMVIANLTGEYSDKTVGSYTYVYSNATERTLPYFLFNSTVSGKVRISNISVKQLSGIYPITNYLSTCRTQAQNLEYGRQNALLKRDALGVEYASSFDAMECDGVSYVDTGWIPPSDSDFAIEVELVFDDINAGTSYIGAYDSGANRFTFGKGAGSSYMYIAIGNSVSGLTHIGKAVETGNKMLVVIDNINNSARVWNNGVYQGERIYTFDGSVNTFNLQATGNLSTTKWKGQIPQFKVHTDTTKGLENYLAQHQGV